ncbi:MAG: hypothetical protein EAX96_11210 [Candidatus Lokiarchaeota archaeon]|nr:hypothetical protein [Candidatus Lokiarchaeota archaeon]
MQSIEKILSDEIISKIFQNDYEILDFAFSSSKFLIFLIKIDKIYLCFLENGSIRKVPIDFNTIKSGKFRPNKISIDSENRIYAFMEEKKSESVPSCVKVKFDGEVESYYFFKNHISNLLIDSEGNIFVSYHKMDEFLRDNKLLEKYDASGDLITSRFPSEQVQITTIRDFFLDKKDKLYVVGINEQFGNMKIYYFIKLSSYLDIIDIFIDMEQFFQSELSNITLNSQNNIFVLLKKSNTLKKLDQEKNFIDIKLGEFSSTIKKILILDDNIYLTTRKELIKITGLEK